MGVTCVPPPRRRSSNISSTPSPCQSSGACAPSHEHGGTGLHTAHDQRLLEHEEGNPPRNVLESVAGGPQKNTLASLAGIATDLRRAIKAYEQNINLPYQDVPQELCQVKGGEREIDLTAWSLLVTDSSLRRIATSEKNRIDALAEQDSIQQVESHVEEMGLSGGLKNIDDLGIACFDVSSMVTRREQEALERMKANAFESAKERFVEEQGLTSLNIAGGDKVADGGIAAIAAQCCCLRSLNVSGAHQVSDVAIRALALSCTGLTRLNLSGCTGICGPGLAAMGECCPKLVELNVSKCKQIGHWVLARVFRGCPELETLTLAHCPRVGDEELRELASSCRALTNLNLNECNQISDTGMVEVARRCRGLASLDLTRTALHFKVGDVTLLALGDGCHGLHKLVVRGCDGITDMGISWMSAGCPVLEHLDITGCVKVSNPGLTSLSRGCPSLSYLSMAGLKLVTDVGVARLGAGCQRLVYLDLSGVVKLSDGTRRDFGFTGIQALAQGCVMLKTLALDGCFQVSKTVLGAIGHTLHSLERLSMSNCPALSLEGLCAVAEGCPRLTDVNLSRCGGSVTDAALASISKNCPGLRKLTLRGIAGTPAPMGAPGMIAVCANCKRLECLDLGDVRGLEDATFAFFHEHPMAKLSRVNLAGCPRISGLGVQWLADGCPALSWLNVEGTRVTLTALNILKERYPYSLIKVRDNFLGLAPLQRLKERLAIKSYAALHFGARRIQHCFRSKKAWKDMMARRSKRAEERAAYLLMRSWRRRMGRARLQELRLAKDEKARGAVVIQKLWRKAIASSLVIQLRRELREVERRRHATSVQRSYRGLRGRRIARRRKLEAEEVQRRRASAAPIIQRQFRMCRAKRELAALREAAERRRLRREHAATALQTEWRGFRARKALKRLKSIAKEDEAKRNEAATQIQDAMRMSLCRWRLERKRRERSRRHASATVIQRHYRGARARAMYTGMRRRWQREKELAAALQLQCWFRSMRSRAELVSLASKNALRKIEEMNAAKILQQSYRRYLVRLEVAATKESHQEKVRAMARLENWAATQIQAFARGVAGRAVASAKKLDHMGRWREMYDEDQGSTFYYSRITGEVRWRRPQDFLELLPRPACGDCAQFEAFCECADCGEFFCSLCFRKVHGGGKRLHHEFRALYDFYGKRVDYGDGEFPSRWPTDILQDDQNGWNVRVQPERAPAEERSQWARYASESEDQWEQDLFYNTETGESTYSPPADWDSIAWASAQGAMVSPTFGAESEDTDWSYESNQSSLSLDGLHPGIEELHTPRGGRWQIHWDDANHVNYYFNEASTTFSW